MNLKEYLYQEKPAFPLKKQPPKQPVCEARKEQIHDSLLS